LALAARVGGDPARRAERVELPFAGRDGEQIEQFGGRYGINGCARIATWRITSAVT